MLYLKEKGTDKIAVNINLQQEFDELAIKFNLLNPFKKKINIPTYVLILIFSQITDIYNYGGEILTVFLMQLNQYSKINKNQVFTPPHIAGFICQAVNINNAKVVFDGTCGTGVFFAQSLITNKDIKVCGIEIEESTFELCKLNVLINSGAPTNIKNGCLFACEDFIRETNPDIILMNPPYNASTINIPDVYKTDWKNEKEDPTRGLIFLKFISDVLKNNKKHVKAAIILPISCAIGDNKILTNLKTQLLSDNSLDAVFTLPNKIFSPSACVNTCCMVFTLGKPHINPDGTANKTFFGYFKEDGHKNKKNLGRVEQFDKNNNSIWKAIEKEWLDLYRNKIVKDGLSVMQTVTGDDEWLYEAYMKTDYSKLCEKDFIETRDNYLVYLIKSHNWQKFHDFVSESKAWKPMKCDTSKWKEFRVGDIFKPQKIKHFATIPDKKGNTPFVSSTSDNNGIVDYVNAKSIKGNCITVSTNGICFACFYQSESIVLSNDAEALYNNNLNVYNAMFIVSVMQMEKIKYGYGRKPKNNKVYDTKIKLPADSNGQPDWLFMENYIKSLPYGDKLDG